SGRLHPHPDQHLAAHSLRRYTVTHPHEVTVLQADAAVAIDLTEDVGKQPLDFEAAVTTGDVGPFLTSLDGPLLPGPGLTGNACTSGDTCLDGDCVDGPVLHCDDWNSCTTDECDHSDGCVHVPNNLPCDDDGSDDGDMCRARGTCVDGACVHRPVDCDDGNECTTDGCDRSQGCWHTSNSLSCDDGDACTMGDTCADGACVGGRARDCDDGNGCTTDSCDRSWGCVQSPNI